MTTTEIEIPAALFSAADEIAAAIKDLQSELQAKESALAEKRALHTAILESYPSAESYAGFARASLASMAEKGAKELYWQIDSIAHPKRYGVMVGTDMQKPLTFKEMRDLMTVGVMDGSTMDFDGFSVLPNQYMGAPSRNLLAFLLREEVQLKIDAMLAATPVALRHVKSSGALRSYAQLEQELKAAEDEVRATEDECAAIRQNITRLGGKV